MFKKKEKKLEDKPKAKQKPKTNYSGGVLAIVIVLLILSLTALAFLYLEYDKLEGKLADPNYLEELIEKDTENGGDLLAQVGRHIRLSDETPQIATIANIENLIQEQPFFSGSKNGDRVLIYPDKVIVYDEAEDIIVNVGFLTANEYTSTSTVENVSEDENTENEIDFKPLSVEVRNGSVVRGLAGNTRNHILESENFEVTGVANAARSDYEQGVIVDLSDGSKQPYLDELKEILNLEIITELPEGEVSSPAEIVVIVVE